VGDTIANPNILVAGGYGVVGRLVCRELARRGVRVVVAGRKLDRATEVARNVGGLAVARELDLDRHETFRDALEEVTTIVDCIGDSERTLLELAIARGLAYTTIAPYTLSLGAELSIFDAAARQSRSRIIFGAGISPGISSVMAARCAERLGGLDSIELALSFGIGDHYGPASTRYMLGASSEPFEVTIAGATRRVTPFETALRVAFPRPIGVRNAYLFPFSDAASFPHTLRARSSTAYLALDPPWIMRLLRSLPKRHGMTASPAAMLAVFDQLRKLYKDRDRWALVVCARGPGGAAKMKISSRGQAYATAVCAAEVALLLATQRELRPGLHFPEQVLIPERFLTRLAAHGLVVESSAIRPETERAHMHV
jgi:saccharopine dehydrogenase (NAD+, L-lysine forming)